MQLCSEISHVNTSGLTSGKLWHKPRFSSSCGMQQQPQMAKTAPQMSHDQVCTLHAFRVEYCNRLVSMVTVEYERVLLITRVKVRVATRLVCIISVDRSQKGTGYNYS